MIAASGVRTAARSSASSAVLGRDGLEARVAQHHPQRPQDLGLVVADEHARPVGGSSSRRRPAPARARPGCPPATGNSTTKVVPCPGSDSAAICAAVGLDEAAGDREPQPGAPVAPVVGSGAVERLEDPRSSCAAGIPGPRSTIRRTSATRPPARGPRPATPPSSAGALSSRLAMARSSCAASARRGGRSSATATEKASWSPGRCSIGRRDDLLERAPGPSRLGGAGLQAREVEELVDHAGQAAALGGDDARELGPLVVGQRRGGAARRRRRRWRSAATGGRGRRRAAPPS